MRDIWLRLCTGMPESWCADMAKDWRNFFDSVVQEAVNRFKGAVPTEGEYRANRDTTGYMRLLLRLSERMRYYAVPSRVGQDAAFQALMEPYVWAHNILQDLFSFERECVQGDMHNIVFVLEHHRHMTRPQAIEAAVGLLREQFAAFLHAGAALPSALDRLGVPGADRVRDCQTSGVTAVVEITDGPPTGGRRR
ncbi:terpene synthase family protein [Streptomyces sp. NPDC002159]